MMFRNKRVIGRDCFLSPCRHSYEHLSSMKRVWAIDKRQTGQCLPYIFVAGLVRLLMISVCFEATAGLGWHPLTKQAPIEPI